VIDVRRLRADRPGLEVELARKGVPPELVRAAAGADTRWRAAQAAADDWRRRRKEGSQAVARATGQERDALLAEMREVSSRPMLPSNC
jgi:seryl-tRNA synthetase